VNIYDSVSLTFPPFLEWPRNSTASIFSPA
jgi:hypothetical protein